MGGVAARETAVPHFVGRYEVLVPIASGGMATVYLARSRGAGGFERDVALKLTHVHLRESPEFQTLLIEEAKLASAIRHHNVVSVLDVGDDPLGLFLVMDYVEGDTLSGLIRRAKATGEPMPLPLAMRALADALAGLHAAHETRDSEGKPLEIVHRDFSPQNILVGTDGIAKLTDFGIAKAASRAGNTSTGILKGKIAYMSPEQARGEPLDRRADVWAAGVLAWEIIAGRPMWPREAEDVPTLIKLVTTTPPRLRDVDPTISEALDAAVAKALTMQPAERWPTAAAFSKALISCAELADAEQLAEYARVVAGPKIEQRREQIRSMGALRTKMGEITEASVMTPSGEYQSRKEKRPEIPIIESERTEVLAGAPVAAAPAAFAPIEVVTTETTSASDAHIVARRGPPRWAIPAVAGVVGVSLLVIIIAAISSQSSANANANADAHANANANANANATTPATGTTLTSPPTATATATAIKPATAATTATQATTTPTATHTHTAATHTAPATTTRLAPSPY